MKNEEKGSQPTGKRRGRKPKATGRAATAKEKLEELYAEAMRKSSVPAMYVSTTRGSMKLNYEGHHFYFKYKRGPYTLFNCCFKENGEECKVRVIVCNQRVYHLDGEHVHFRQAVDKSATSVAFEVDTVEDCSEENKAKEADEIAQEIFNDLVKDDELATSIQSSAKQPIKILNSQAVAKPLKPSPQGVKQEQMDPEDFKEKIKRRLQNALLKKK